MTATVTAASSRRSKSSRSSPDLVVVQPPTPPSSKSVTAKGALKDTPANRALHARVTPQPVFTARGLVRDAFFHDERSVILCGDNVWVKPNPVPDQVRDRCSISHEYVFHFTKARWYYFDQRDVGRRVGKSLLPPLDTWVVPTARGSGVHKASFPEELVRLPILATTPPNGIVLDPFNGSGTSMVVARANGRRAIGIDLSREYCELAKTALSAAGR